MVKFKCVRTVAPFAKGRLHNFTFFNKASFFPLTLFTSKSCFFHFRYDIRAPNDDSTKSYEFFKQKINFGIGYLNWDILANKTMKKVMRLSVKVVLKG